MSRRDQHVVHRLYTVWLRDKRTGVLDLERLPYARKDSVYLLTVSGTLTKAQASLHSAVPSAFERLHAAAFKMYCTLIARRSSAGRCSRSASSSFSTSSRRMLRELRIGGNSDVSGCGTSQLSSCKEA